MFGKKENSKETTFEPANTNLRNSTQSQIRTLISEGCKFEGNLYSPAYTRIDGIVRGNLTGESGLIIGDKGSIEGDITSIEVTIYGNVKGNVKAHKLEVKKGGRIYGDIIVDHLLMEHGAVFIGHCKMNEGNSASAEAFELPEDENKD
ncbi:MAG: polymer-forming cytoskeletal protein [Ignavibacteria bacterium]|jgi:cytoskeletal protein CcmA (bactofilin family)|nr:polymer-forming cytoskeletal protein [Ignavibacteria bacterium]